MRVSLTTVFALALVVLPGMAAMASAQPTAEHKRLDSFVGKWSVESEIKPSPSYAGGKLAGTEECESFANLHVVCRAELTGPTGLYRSMRVLSYLPALKQYGQYTVDSLGYASFAMGSFQGGTWTFTTDVVGAKLRNVIKTSGASYTTTTEYAGADGKWVATATGKSTRAK